MMNRDSFLSFLEKEFPEGIVCSNGNEFRCRCRFCGDSDNLKEKHFYISLNHPSKLIYYNCFKCPAGGILTGEVLREITRGKNHVGISMQLDSHNKDILKIPYNNLYKNQIFSIKNDFISDCSLSKDKLAYINRRLGLNLSYNDMIKNKIVLNLYDLINSNSITSFTREKFALDEFNAHYIGFLSMDNTIVNLRKFDDKPIKYSGFGEKGKYVIKENLNGNTSAYIIPTEINPLKKINVHITEGAFDILSVYYNLHNQEYPNSLYCSINGKAYLSMIRNLITHIGLIDADFHVYMDNDVKPYIAKGIAKVIIPLGIDVYIHKNVYPNMKDYGVPKENIKDYVYKLEYNSLF